MMRQAADRVAACLLLLLLAPAILGCAFAIRRCSPGPILFRQAREGLRQQPFPLLKLRTMTFDAERRLDERLRTDAAAALEWRRYGFLRDDPRIAGAWARWARRLSLDEVPQLWNVVRGEMALVGPRPLPLDLAARLPAAERARRASVRPGITGLWQVRGRSDLDLRQMQRLDRLYIGRSGVRLDLWILFRTPMAVLSRRGAY